MSGKTSGEMSRSQPQHFPAITYFVKQRTHGFFRRRVFAANATHVPTAAFFCQAVFIHGNKFRQRLHEFHELNLRTV